MLNENCWIKDGKVYFNTFLCNFYNTLVSAWRNCAIARILIVIYRFALRANNLLFFYSNAHNCRREWLDYLFEKPDSFSKNKEPANVTKNIRCIKSGLRCRGVCRSFLETIRFRWISSRLWNFELKFSRTHYRKCLRCQCWILLSAFCLTHH